LGIILIAGIGYGAYYWQNQKSNIKDQNDISKIKDITPTTPPTPQSSDNPIVESSDETVDPTADLPAKDSSTEGWKTYENKDYGYEYKYPNTWQSSENTPSGADWVSMQSSSVFTKGAKYDHAVINGSYFNVGIEKLKDQTAQSLKAKIQIDYPDAEITTININGVNSIKGILPQRDDRGRAADDERIVYIPNNADSIYSVVLRSENDYTDLDQILSTFKFTK